MSMKVRSFAAGLALIVGATSCVVKAQESAPASIPYSYRNVAIVAGGFISGIVPHPTQAGLIYVRTDIGGAYRWDAGKRVWIPLTDWVSVSNNNLLGIESIAVDPSDPARLYLAAGTYDKSWSPNGAILRSNDQGEHFEISPMPVKMGGNEEGRFAGERLAVDPNSPNILYFGSRDDGLWKSTDAAKTWARVDAFPGKSENRIGVVFVVFDAHSGHAKAATPLLYAGVSSLGTSLFVSKDAGATWQAVPGAPTGLLPIHGALAADGSLYLTCGDKPGPNGMTNGAVWKLNTRTGAWKDISPEIPNANGAPTFGYAGLALGKPGTVMVATMDRWKPGDEIFRSLDGGAHWVSIGEYSERDPSLSPFLVAADGKVPLGHWFGAVAIDPFDGNHALYGTGETLWSTNELERVDAKKTAHWVVGGAGIEETAVRSLLSPPKGPHLFSGVYDIGCFRHVDFAVSPRGGSMQNPRMSNCDSIEYAPSNPDLMVRVGLVWHGDSHGGYSRDGGVTWTPFASEPAGGDKGGTIAISADGSTLLWETGTGTLASSKDLGKRWASVAQAPQHARVVADSVHPGRFYVYDPGEGKLYAAEGSELALKLLPIDVPKRGKLMIAPGYADDLWIASDAGLWRGTGTAAKPMNPIAGVEAAYALGFGRAQRDGGYPALYLSGKLAGQEGLFRSVDEGAHWVRINNDQQGWGKVQPIAGDPRIFGRVYLGTNGRGVFYGDPQP
jgi:photosystem II stability/assembly factor-like uncharacterized protein